MRKKPGRRRGARNNTTNGLTKATLSEDPTGLGRRWRRRWVLQLGSGWSARLAHRIRAMHGGCWLVCLEGGVRWKDSWTEVAKQGWLDLSNCTERPVKTLRRSDVCEEGGEDMVFWVGSKTSNPDAMMSVVEQGSLTELGGIDRAM